MDKTNEKYCESVEFSQKLDATYPQQPEDLHIAHVNRRARLIIVCHVVLTNKTIVCL